MPTPNPAPVQRAVPIAYMPPQQIAEEEINLLDLWRVLVREKWLIFLFTVLCTAGAVAAALTMTPIFRAEVLLEPITEEGKQGGGLMAQNGGLIAMTGISDGGGSTKDTTVAKLQSRVFVEEFLNDENLLPVLFHEIWDPQTKSWQVEDPKQIPSMWDGVESFKNNILKISEDKKTGLITLAIEWQDRKQVSRWANLLVKRINRHLRGLAIQDAKKSIEYLNNELTKTQIIELQRAIVNLLEGQIEKIMLANVRAEFAFKVIDPAVVPPENRFIKPKRQLMVVLGFVLGGFLGIFAAFFRNFLRQQKGERQQDSSPENG